MNEANFFLEKINEYYQDDAKCEYCVSAFLHATYDLLDHTLEEYRLQFHLKVEGELTIKNFIKAANKNQNTDALGFMALYLTELHKLYTNPVSASMLALRNTNTHSSTNLTPFSTFTEHRDGTIETDYRRFLGALDVALPFFRNDLKGYVCAKSKNMHDIGEHVGLTLPIAALSDLNTIYVKACEILTATDVEMVCKMYLKLLDGFVSAIRAKYPRW